MKAVAAACALARELARAPVLGADRRGRTRAVRVAMGDPQAPLNQVMRVLGQHDLLTKDGRLREDVALYSMGDHFDWGDLANADAAREDGLALLAWLASHDPDHVHLVAGNHDMARVGELAPFDDASFREAQAEAAPIYASGDAVAERAFLARHPALPSAEVAARDFAAFTTAQQVLVARLLQARRLRLAHAPAGDVLLTHAGITARDLGAIGVDPAAGAPAIAEALNAHLDEAVAAWAAGAPRTPLTIPPLHVPGDAARGEGTGILYHRPTSDPRGQPGRRFDPRTIPRGLTQVIGHIGDPKCRTLMPAWSEGETLPGELRTLVTGDARTVYRPGVAPSAPEEGRIVFTDGTMRRVDARMYALFDLDRRAPFAP